MVRRATQSAVLLLFAIWMSVAMSPAFAAEQEDAVAATDEIMTLFATKQFATVWDQKTSTWMKGQVTRDAFLANLTMGRAPLGDRISARFITSEFTTKDPGTGMSGRIYANMYLTEYTVGKFYERIVVIKETDGKFRLSGLWGSPAQ